MIQHDADLLSLLDLLGSHKYNPKPQTQKLCPRNWKILLVTSIQVGQHDMNPVNPEKNKTQGFTP